MAGNEVEVKITVEERQALAALNKLNRTVGKDIPKSAKIADRAMGSFIGNLASGVVLGAINGLRNSIGGFATGAIAASGKIETLSTQLEVLTGSALSAKMLMQELTDFSASTPFQIEGLAEASKKLLSFGFEQETIIDRLKELGDVAAGSGADIGELSLIYGQVAAAGKLTGERLLQMQERAIPIGPALAKTMGVAESSVRGLVSAGKVGFAEFETAFNTLNDASGQFFGGMEKRSKTQEGVISTLSDNFFILQTAIGDAFKPAVIEGGQELTTIFQELTKTFKDNGPAMVETVSSLSQILLVTPAKFWVDVFTDVTASKSINQITSEMSALDKEMETIQARLQENKDSTLYNSFFGKKDDDLAAFAEAGAALGKLAALKEKLTAKEGDSNFTGPIQSGSGAAPVADDGAVESEIAKQAKLTELKELAFVADQERALIINEAKGIATEQELADLESFELAKIQIARDAELAGTKDKQKQLEIDAKFDAKIREQELKTQVKHEKAKLALSQATAQANLNIAKNTGALLTQVLGADNKAGFVITQAAGIAQAIVATQLAMAKALAVDPTGLLSTRVGIAGGINVATIAAQTIQGFENGGILGGNSPTGDKLLFRGNSGEVILNENQMDADAGRIRGIDNLTNAINSQPIILQIDSREIARAVKDEIDSGFNLGVA